MRLSTPAKFQKFFYLGIDTFADVDDELFGIGISSLYFGIYPIQRGLDFSVGIVDANGCLN